MLDTTAVFILLIPCIYNQDSVPGPLFYNRTGENFPFSCPEGYINLAVKSSKEQNTLRELIYNRVVTGDVWVPVVRVKYVWLDGFEVDKSFYESPWSADQTCGLLHLRDEVTEVDTCQLRQMGYICGPQGETCADVPPPEQCINVNGKFFIYKCIGSISWGEAKQACANHSLTLGIVRGLFRILSEMIYGSNGYCKKAWIGMHKDEKWVLKNPDTTKPLENARYTNWDTEKPSSFGDCAVASFPTGRWKTVDCTQTANYVCMPSIATHTTSFPTEDLQERGSTPATVTERKTPPNTTAETSAGGRPVAMIVGIAVGLGVLLLIIIISIIICYKIRKKRRKDEREELREREVMTPLRRPSSSISDQATVTTERPDNQNNNQDS